MFSRDDIEPGDIVLQRGEEPCYVDEDYYFIRLDSVISNNRKNVDKNFTNILGSEYVGRAKWDVIAVYKLEDIYKAKEYLKEYSKEGIPWTWEIRYDNRYVEMNRKREKAYAVYLQTSDSSMTWE